MGTGENFWRWVRNIHGSGISSSSVSEDDDEEDENAFVGEYSGDDRLLELGLGGDGGLFGGS